MTPWKGFYLDLSRPVEPEPTWAEAWADFKRWVRECFVVADAQTDALDGVVPEVNAPTPPDRVVLGNRA